MSNGAQSKQCSSASPPEISDLLSKIVIALTDLGWIRLIFRGEAFYCVSDAALYESQIIIRGSGPLVVRETEFV
jgi:hypothetical protein